MIFPRTIGFIGSLLDFDDSNGLFRIVSCNNQLVFHQYLDLMVDKGVHIAFK